MSSENNADRRDYFRIRDSVILSYRVPTEAQVVEPHEPVTKQDFGPINDLTRLSQDTQHLRGRLRREMPIVAHYFDILEKKIELLARVIIRQNLAETEKNIYEVNLSAGGIQFEADEAIPLGSKVELRFTVFPSCLSILTRGEVLRCEANQSSKQPEYRVALKFIHLTDADREFIVKHVLDKQSRELRQEKLLSD